MSVVPLPPPLGKAAPALAIPAALETGDRLTAAQFHERYSRIPEVKKAELIDGTVYMGSPVGNAHARPHLIIATWLGNYLSKHPDLLVGDNNTVMLDADN